MNFNKFLSKNYNKIKQYFSKTNLDEMSEKERRTELTKRLFENKILNKSYVLKITGNIGNIWAFYSCSNEIELSIIDNNIIDRLGNYDKKNNKAPLIYIINKEEGLKKIIYLNLEANEIKEGKNITDQDRKNFDSVLMYLENNKEL